MVRLRSVVVRFALVALAACAAHSGAAVVELPAPRAAVREARAPAKNDGWPRRFEVRFAKAWSSQVGTEPLLARHPDGDVLLGYFDTVQGVSAPDAVGKILFARFGADGSVRAVHQFEESGYAASFAFDAAGGSVLAGTSSPSAAGTAGTVWRLAPDGARVWRYATRGAVHFSSVAIDEAGRVTAAGTFRGTVDVGLGPLVSSHATNTASEYETALVVGLDARGHARWARAWDEVDARVFVTRTGRIRLVGRSGRTSSGTIDLGGGPLEADRSFYAELDADGRHVRSRALDFDVVHVATTRGGRIALLGYTRGEAGRYRVVELDDTGGVNRTLALPAVGQATSLGLDDGDHLFIGAFLRDDLRFDGVEISAHRDQDGPEPFVVLELDARGRLLRSQLIRNGRCDTMAVARNGTVAVGGWTDRRLIVGSVDVAFPATPGGSALFLTLLGP